MYSECHVEVTERTCEARRPQSVDLCLARPRLVVVPSLETIRPVGSCERAIYRMERSGERESASVAGSDPPPLLGVLLFGFRAGGDAWNVAQLFEIVGPLS